MGDSRSGAGGKIVNNRRKQRLSATPYDRPPPSPLQQPTTSRPSWFSGLIVPSARAIALGTGKIISSILYSESSSSSEEEIEDFAAEDDCGHSQEYEIRNDGDVTVNEKIETKRLIEKLIVRESFSREECDRLTQVLKSRVVDWPADKEWSLATSPWKIISSGDGEFYDEAVLEAKKWFQEKKMGSTSSEKVDGAVGSPVDVARSYMRSKQPWTTPTKQIDLSTPWNISEMFKEGVYSTGINPLSSLKKRSSIASGSWNIQEEIRKVRAKATEDMLRSPSSKFDLSMFASATREKNDAKRFVVEKSLSGPDSSRQTHLGALVDAGVFFDPSFAASGSGQDDEAGETLVPKSVDLTSINNEESGDIQINGGASKKGTLNADSYTRKDISEIHRANGISSAHASSTPGVPTLQNQEPHHKGMLEFSTEDVCVEVPILTEEDSFASGSQESLSKQYEELSEETANPTAKEKTDAIFGQKPKKTGENARSRRRGK